MASNANPSPSSSQAPTYPRYLATQQVEELMDLICDPEEMGRFHARSTTHKSSDRRTFCSHYLLCLDAYPKIESTTKMLNALLKHLKKENLLEAGNEDLARDAATLAAHMDIAETSIPPLAGGNSGLQSIFLDIAKFSSRQLESKIAKLILVQTHLKKTITVAKKTNFSEVLNGVMHDNRSRADNTVTVRPVYRLLRAIRARRAGPLGTVLELDQPKSILDGLVKRIITPLRNELNNLKVVSMDGGPHLYSMIFADIQTLQGLLTSNPACFIDDAARKECDDIIQAWKKSTTVDFGTPSQPTPTPTPQTSHTDTALERDTPSKSWMETVLKEDKSRGK
ncbi:hypothetical protein QBC39DRAFT_341076 [Podospora conica]|nr:hypothetical protein QBC39DRAFT_341076 [Schizothecium conicum]